MIRMDMERLLNILTGFSVGLIGLVLFHLRRAHIRVEYSVSWLGAAVTLLVLSRWKWGLSQLAGLLGIHDAPLALFMLVFIIFFIVFYRFSIIISQLKDANIALTQRVAILEFQSQSTNEKQ
jgi:hypothetical protein